MTKRVHVYISGRVQGVFFRSETNDAAQRLGVTGWVRNLRDGRVEALFEGDDGAVEQMVAWCSQGPALSLVDHVETIEEEYRGEFSDFNIRY
ncbi:MAG: acylphosphatase [Deltaproteobacteria bacterium]|nr:acylphosphatase [Deltaproteobacteria bacterium]